MRGNILAIPPAVADWRESSSTLLLPQRKEEMLITGGYVLDVVLVAMEGCVSSQMTFFSWLVQRPPRPTPDPTSARMATDGCDASVPVPVPMRLLLLRACSQSEMRPEQEAAGWLHYTISRQHYNRSR